jgi:hypothetical protein
VPEVVEEIEKVTILEEMKQINEATEAYILDLLNQSQTKLATDVDIKCYRGYEALFEMMSHHYIELIKARM